MKKLFFLFCLSLFISPSLILAQASCFSNQPQDVSVLPMISEDMNCALEVVGVDCPVQTGEEVTILYSPEFGNSDFCDIWCDSQHPLWGSASEQLNIFNRILAFAESNAPNCSENGEPMVLTNIVVDQDVLGQAFFVASLTFACCILPEDCEADFVIEWDPNDCSFNLTNASTPSTFVDCGDCENPSGITNVSWSAGSYYTNGQWVSYTPLGSGNGFNFSFGTNGIGKFTYIEVCLEIEDCNGCESRVCKTIDRLFPCFGLTEDDEQQYRQIIKPNAQPVYVYPNPATHDINVNINDDELNMDGAIIELHDLQGRLIKTIKNVSKGTNTIDISELENNLYIFSVIVNGDRVHLEKLIVGEQ